jgi:SAM-dependent methyltransferase
MSDVAKFSARQLLDILDLSAYRHLLDLAGGPATYTMAFLEAYPDMRATLFDLPEVVEIAREQVEAAGLTDRVTFLPGDLTTDDYGSGYDLVLLSNIIHSFSPETNLEMVRKCHDALDSGGTLVIKDFLVDNDRSGPAFSLMFALNMLVNTRDGDTYTFAEVEEWTREAGFVDGEVHNMTPQTRMWVAKKA